MLAQRIARLRIQRGLTQLELSKACGVSVSTIKNWESGLYEPHLDHIKALCTALRTSADYLLGLSEKHMVSLEDLEDSDVEYIKQTIQILLNKNSRIRNAAEKTEQ